MNLRSRAAYDKNLERISQLGDFILPELEIKSRQNPSIVPDNLEAEYLWDISKSLTDAINGFGWNSRYLQAEYSNPLLLLKYAEQRIKEAKEMNYKVNESLDEVVEEISSNVQYSFNGSRTFLAYLRDSGSKYRKHKLDLENVLPVLAQDYADKVLKNIRKNIPRLKKRTKRIGNYIRRIANDIGEIEKLESYGVNRKKEISNIKNEAKDLILCKTTEAYVLAFTDVERSKKMLSQIIEYADLLGINISNKVSEIRCAQEKTWEGYDK